MGPGGRVLLVLVALLFSPLGLTVQGASPLEHGTPDAADALSGHLTALAALATPAPVVVIPAGWFLMGTSHQAIIQGGFAAPYDDTELPQRRIWLDPYQIDRDEVRLSNYLAWLLHNRRPLSPALRNRLGVVVGATAEHILAAWPITDVNWFEAAEYCRAAGRRLPSEAEWEKAARGPDGRIFPWGNLAPNAQRAVFGRPATAKLPPLAPVDGSPAGRSPYGLHQMAGNAAEWVADWSGIDYYVTMPERNPPGPAGGRYKVVRGGSWRSAAVMLRAATRSGAPPEQRSPTIGFRCAESAS